MRIWLVLAAAGGFLGVLAGAFGAHALRTRLPADMLMQFETGVRYHLIHALALLGVAILAGRPELRATAPLTAAGVLFTAGIVLFSGSLYAYALTGARFVVPLAPVGGTALLLGWLALAWAALGLR